MSNKVTLLLDSGVFSAWTRGEELLIKDYIQYLKANKAFIWNYVNLDVIPGKFGRIRTQQETEESAKGSYDNLQTMKGEGLRPVPVFHQGESFKWFERMLNDGERYIGISSAKDLWAEEQAAWLDQVFSIITDVQGRPLIRTHGFGITNPRMLLRYPWYTVDSTTWVLFPGYGQLMIPSYHGGKPNYLTPPQSVVVTGVTSESSAQQKKQFESLGPTMQDHVLRFLEQEVGISIGEARYGTQERRRAMLVYFMNLAKAVHQLRFTHKRHGLLGGTALKLPKLKPVDIPHPQIHFVTQIGQHQWSDLMNEIGANNRLLSYYELKDLPHETFQKYIRDGFLRAPTRKSPRQRWDDEGYRNYRRLRLFKKVKSNGQEVATGET